MEIENQPQEPQQQEAERHEILEGLKNLGSLDDQTEGLKPGDEQKAAEDADDQDGEAEDQDQAEAEESDETDDQAEEADEEPGEPEPEPESEPELARKLEAIQKAEARAQESIAKMRAEFKAEQEAFAKEREQWAPAFEEFNRHRARAQHDPAGVLAALGVDLAESGELAARQIYSMSNAAASDPKTRAAAQEALRSREMMTRLEQLEQNNKQLEQQLFQQTEAIKLEQQAKEYMGGLAKSVEPEGAPLVHRKMKNSPDEAQSMLAEVAIRIVNETGEKPDYEDVVSALESQLKKELNSLGIDPELILSAKKKTAAAEKKPAKSLSSKELATPTTPRAEPKTPEEIDAEILAGLRKLRS